MVKTWIRMKSLTLAALLMWVALVLGFSAAQLRAQGFLEDTVLAGLYRSGNSEVVLKVSGEKALLSDGSKVSLEQWYSSGIKDLNVTLLTTVDDSFGVLWGFGLGESGAKFRIDPSLTLGFVYKQDLGRASTLSLRVSTVLGGRLTEWPCTADYGLIGGVQKVNCRMASSILPPAETLEYLFDDPPHEQVQISLTYEFRF